MINISLLYDQSAMKYMHRINIMNTYVMEDFKISVATIHGVQYALNTVTLPFPTS